MPHFRIKCKNCGTLLKDTYCAFCEHCSNALLVTEYSDKDFQYNRGEGIWRFNWLPVHKAEFDQPGPVVYHSEALGKRLGLESLFIAFNGYWPERGAHVLTCTFKEYEAAVALENARENGMKGLVVASAGNTARAFAHISSKSDFPIIIVVPKMCLLEMWYLIESVRVPTVALSDGDYADSIDLARRISSVLDMPFEGGVKNIAKRDGLGVVLMEAVRVMGRLPEHYFQAVGSGTGAIGVWEMAERLLKDGRYGNRLPELHLAQNLPFVPMVKAWKRKSRELNPAELDPALINLITTRVLSNRYPAYSVKGGIYDALTACGGDMYGVENDEVFYAMRLFEDTEGIDIVPASGVALAALIRAVKDGRIKSHETVLLNITGGGERLVEKERGTFIVEPVFVSKNTDERELEEILCKQLKTD